MPNHDAEATMNGEASATVEGGTVAPCPPGVWQYRKTLKINQRLVHVCNLAIDATKMEIGTLRRKIDKLTYGS
jgi:hypothetical protein